MIQSFGTIFLSIMLEAFPFIILGTLISSMIEVLMPSSWIERAFSEKKRTKYLVAGLIGIIFPVCECAIVPIMRRLVKKGMPLSIGVTFMLSVPIVNPVVLLSTYYAFSGQWSVVLGRGIGGYLLAVIIGMIVARYDHKEVLVEEMHHEHCHDHNHGHGCSCGHAHGDHDESHKEKVKQIIEHTGGEILDVGRFLIGGAMITALMQTFVSREIFVHLASSPVISIILMMALAFVLSLCSEADAFIASTFAGQFSQSSLLAFLIFGPMIDIKNTMMLSGSFRKAFVIRLIAIITLVVFAAMWLFSGFGQLWEAFF